MLPVPKIQDILRPGAGLLQEIFRGVSYGQVSLFLDCSVLQPRSQGKLVSFLITTVLYNNRKLNLILIKFIVFASVDPMRVTQDCCV